MQKVDIFEIYFRYCLLTKSEDSAGAHFRIKPTCIILTLIQIFVYKLLFTIVFFGKIKKNSQNLSHFENESTFRNIKKHYEKSSQIL